MKTLNVRLLAILLVIAIVSGIGLLGAHQLQMRRQRGSFLEQAKVANAKPTLEERWEAEKYFSKYLHFAPDDVDVRAEFGMLCADAKQVPMAVTQLERVLRTDSTHVEARRRLVEIYLGLRRFSDAENHLVSLRDRFPDDADVLMWTAVCQTGRKNYKAAKNSYEMVISQFPDRLEAYRDLARLIRRHSDEIVEGEHLTPPEAAGGGETTEDAPSDKEREDAKDGSAEQRNEAAKKEDDKSESNREAQAVKDGEEADAESQKLHKETTTAEEDADRWMNAMVEKNPKTAKAYLYRGVYFLSTRRLEEATKDSAKALELDPEDKGVLMLAIRIAESEKDYDTARKYAQRAVKLFPDDPSTYQALSQVERLAGEPAKAREWIDKGVDSTGENPLFLLNKAELLIAEKKLDDVEIVLRRLNEFKLPTEGIMQANYIQGRLAFARREWDKARIFLEPVCEYYKQRSPSMARKAGSLLCVCLARLDRVEEARALQREMGGASAPTPAAATRTVPARRLSLKQLEMRIAGCRKALTQDDAPPETWLALSEALYEKNRRLPESERDFTELETLLSDAANTAPDRCEIPLLRAGIAMLKDRPEEARKVLQDAVAVHPEEWRLWGQLVMYAFHDKNWKQAGALLDDAEKHVEKKGSVRVMRARLALARDGKAGLQEVRQLAEKCEGMSDNEKKIYWSALGAWANQVGDVLLARDMYRKSADVDPTDLPIRVKLFSVLRKEKPVDRKAVGRLLDEIRNIEKKGPNWHYISAWLLSKPDDEDGTERDLDKAIEHLAEARLQRPDWADVYMLLGIVQSQMGKKKAALESFDEGVRQGARGLEGLGAYAHLLMRENRRDEAAKILRLVEKKNVVLAPQAKLLLISGHFSKKEYEQGMERAAVLADELRDAIKENESLTDVLLLAELLRQMAAVSKLQENDDETEKALDESGEMYLKAARMAPDRSRLWLTVISFLNVTGRAQEIGGVLAEAKEKLPPEKVAITMAACYQLLKRTAEAEQQYEKALREVKNNDRVPRIVAEFFLKQTDPEKKKRGRDIVLEIVEGKRQVAEKDLAWARRRWAAVLAGRGDHASYAEGMRLVGENLKMNPDSILDKRLKAKLLGNRPNLSDQAKAVAIFEKLVKSPATVPDDRFQLAKLYSTVGRWNDASGQMLPLLASERPDPRWLVFYIGAQIREGEYRGAEGNLNDLEKLIDSPFTIAKLRATIYSRRHKHDLAIRTIRDYVDNASSTHVPRHSRARRGAQVLESMAKHVRGPGRDAAIEQYLKQAEIYWREFVRKDPEQTKLLVAFLGQQGRREEALEIAEKAWNEDKTRLMGVKAVSLLTRGDPSPDEIARVEKIVEGSIAKQGETVPLLLALAELRAIQKRYEDAEKAYRTVLARDDAGPYRMLALNNLSVFLALRKLKLDEASQMIEEAIELAGAAAPLLDSRATVRLTKGDWRGALSDLTLALADEPTGLRYFHQAQAYLAGKDKDKAREAMDAADSYGLKVEHLQPLERSAYRQLREALQ